MSERNGEQLRLSADERYEMALASDASARRNRPSHLVVIAGLVFVAACATIGVAYFQADAAEADLARRADQRDDLAGLLADLAVLEAGGEQEEDSDVVSPYPQLLSHMERIAREVGLEDELDLPTERRSQDAVGAERVSYTYTVSGSELAPLLAFVRRGRDEIPGMRVAGLTIEPRNNEWVMTVKFERWERTGTS